MQYALLGRTGIFVSRLCLGTMTFGGAGTPIGDALGGLDDKVADVLVGKAIDAGINFIDTADVYAGGQSEEVLGRILGARRRTLVLATKCAARVGSGPNNVGHSRLHIMEALEDSLRRLKTDHIDLYQLHNFDPLTPPEEALAALDDAVRQGKIRYVGCSNQAAWQIMKALAVSDRDRLARFAAVQAYYSLAGCDVEAEIVPMIRDQNLGLLCWSPLAGGLLSGKISRDQSSRDSRRGRRGVQFPPVDEELGFAVVDALRFISDRLNASPAQVALAWLLSRTEVTSAIVGATKPEQLEENLGALSVLLDDEALNTLNAASATEARYPEWILSYRADARVPADHAFDGPSWGP